MPPAPAPPPALDATEPSWEPRAASAPSPARGSPGADVVLITVDTWRADRLALHGAPRDTSPFLDRLADTSLVFDHALTTSSWTWPSMVSIATGLMPSQHQATTIDHAVPPAADTLAEVFAAAGYSTRFVGFNAYLCATDSGFDAGYDAWYCGNGGGSDLLDLLAGDLRQASDPRPRFLHLHLFEPHCPYAPPLQALDALGATPMVRGPDCVPADPLCADRGRADFSELMAAFPTREARACFLEPPDFPDRYLPWPALHEPGDTPEAWAEAGLDWAYAIDHYDAEVRYTDELLSDAAALLSEFGMWDDAWVAITGDHGEEFGEHGRVGHGESLNLETLHVPLLLRPPGADPAWRDVRGQRFGTPVSLVDLAPTLASLVGVSGPEAWQHRDLVARASGHDSGATAWPVVAEHEDVRLVQTETLRLYIDRHADRHPANGWDGPPHRREASHHLHHAADRLDRTDLLRDPSLARRREAAAIADALAAAGPDHFRKSRSFPPEPRVVDPGELAALEALGYVEPPKAGAVQ